MDRICKGHRPERPKDSPEALWSLITRCWDQTPEERPSFKDIAKTLDEIVVERLGDVLAGIAF
jgi:hypothetical protein